MHTLPKVSVQRDVEEYLKSSLRLVDVKGNNSCDAKAEDETSISESFEILCQTLATPPLFTVVRVNKKQLSVEDAKQQLQSILQEKYMNNGNECPTVIKHPVLQDVLVVPGTGPHLDVTPAMKEIIVDSHCGVAVLRGADVFAPGIMAAHPGVQRGDLVSLFADVEGQCRKGITKPYNGKKLFLGNGRAVLGRNEIFCSSKTVSGIAVKLEEALYSAPSLNGILPSTLFLQNLPSVVTGHVLDPKPGDMVLDMCAAPGGKTTHLASLMDDKGIIIALDKSKPKIEKIRANCSRFGLSCVKPFNFDGTKVLDKQPSRIDMKGSLAIDNPPYPPKTFDRILLDAPCSALGQRPQTALKMTLKELQSYPSLQKKLFTAAAELLKEGGVLVYSTCTITAEENETMVAWALQSFPFLKLAAQSPHLGGRGYPGCGLSDSERAMVQRFDPKRLCDKDFSKESKSLWDVDTIGFFIAKFIKNPPGISATD